MCATSKGGKWTDRGRREGKWTVGGQIRNSIQSGDSLVPPRWNEEVIPCAFTICLALLSQQQMDLCRCFTYTNYGFIIRIYTKSTNYGFIIHVYTQSHDDNIAKSTNYGFIIITRRLHVRAPRSTCDQTDVRFSSQSGPRTVCAGAVTTSHPSLVSAAARVVGRTQVAASAGGGLHAPAGSSAKRATRCLPLPAPSRTRRGDNSCSSRDSCMRAFMISLVAAACDNDTFVSDT